MLSTSSRLTTLASSRASSLLTTRITTSSTRSISSLARRASPSTRSCIPLCRSFSSTPSHLDATFDHPHNQQLHHSETSSELSSTSSSSAVAQAPRTSAQVPGPILGGEGKHFEGKQVTFTSAFLDSTPRAHSPFDPSFHSPCQSPSFRL